MTFVIIHSVISPLVTLVFLLRCRTKYPTEKVGAMIFAFLFCLDICRIRFLMLRSVMCMYISLSASNRSSRDVPWIAPAASIDTARPEFGSSDLNSFL